MPFYIIMILVSFVASVIGMLAKENRGTLRWFPPFLLATFLLENYAASLGASGKSNTLIYSVFSAAEALFYLIFIKQELIKFYRTVTFNVIILLYVVFALVNLFFIQGIGTYNTYTYLLGCLLVVVFCIIYFYRLLRSVRSDSLARAGTFWIITALLFFYTCSLPLVGITNFMTGLPKRYLNIMILTLDLCNVLLYILFTVGFLCNINLRKSSQSL